MKGPSGFFVTATDTGVGKTQVSCALLSLMADAGWEPLAFKPYESGCASLALPADALAMRAAARSSQGLDEVCPHRFRAAVAPGVAAARLGRGATWARTLAVYHAFPSRPRVVEGAGGLLVPLDGKRMVVELIEELRLPVVLVARAELGTLNHTGLSLRELARRGVSVAAVVLSRQGRSRDDSVRDNAGEIAARFGVRVLGPVPFVPQAGKRHGAFRRVLAPLVSG